jgi:hypothetical protein
MKSKKKEEIERIGTYGPGIRRLNPFWRGFEEMSVSEEVRNTLRNEGGWNGPMESGKDNVDT